MTNRRITYAGALPQDTDITFPQVETQLGLGAVIGLEIGTTTTVTGLACTPNSPAAMNVLIGAGSIFSLNTMDINTFGTLGTNPAQVMKVANNTTSTILSCPAPTGTSGTSINYLIEAAFQETDTAFTTIAYYNAANPSQPLYGPPGSPGVTQPLVRSQIVNLQVKAGGAAITGTQLTPSVDTGFVPLYIITVAFGQTSITSSSIALHPQAPFDGVNATPTGVVVNGINASGTNNNSGVFLNKNTNQNSLNRWSVTANAATESGSNNGSDFNLTAYTDAGASLSVPLSIKRSTGVVSIGTLGAGAMSITNSASLASSLVLNSPAGNLRNVTMQTSGNSRWIMGTDGSTEAGSNAGSNFQIASFTDLGATLTTAVSIARATGVVAFSASPTAPTTSIVGTYLATTQYVANFGLGSLAGAFLPISGGSMTGAMSSPTITVTGACSVPNVAANDSSNNAANTRFVSLAVSNALSGYSGGIFAPIASPTFTGSVVMPVLTILNGSTLAAAINLQSNAGQFRYLQFQTGTSPRWQIIGADTTAESGSNAGSNFYINRYSDTGTYIDAPMSVNRQTGIANFSQSPTVPTIASLDNSTKVPNTNYISAFFAALNSPSFTGTPTVPTQSGISGTGQIVNSAWLINNLGNICAAYGGYVSPGGNGFLKLPGFVTNSAPMIIQWGGSAYYGYSQGTNNIYYPTAFPNVALFVMASIGTYNNGSVIGGQLSGSNSYFVVGFGYGIGNTTAYAPGVGFNWIAVGY